MRVASVTESEVRLTLEATLDYANHLLDGDLDPRALLTGYGYSGIEEASETSLDRITDHIHGLLDFFAGLADQETDVTAAATRLNTELAELPIHPTVVDHNGIGHHLHWTPDTARFDVKVIADMLMAVAQELCDNGTVRFGVCAAGDCNHLFYDTTRNGSRRFCSDPRCASRTHTADHRARQRMDDGKK